jgi:hypothetical protein
MIMFTHRNNTINNLFMTLKCRKVLLPVLNYIFFNDFAWLAIIINIQGGGNSESKHVGSDEYCITFRFEV